MTACRDHEVRLPPPRTCVCHDSDRDNNRRRNRQNDYPRPTRNHILRRFGCRFARDGWGSMSLPQRVEVSLGLPWEGGSAAYANRIAAVSIGAIVSIDDVFLSIDEGESATPAGWWRGDIYAFMDSALPDGADLETNRGAVFRGLRHCIRVKGVFNRYDSPREDCCKLLQLFGRRTGFRTFARVNLARIPEEPDDTNHEREAHYAYGYYRGAHTRALCNR